MPPAPLQLVVIDTETTGLDPARDRVIEIGAVRLDPGLCVVDRFSTLVDPRQPIPLQITRMTGITAADVAGAPPFAEAFARLREFVGDAIVVGQNIAYDMAMLRAEATRCGTTPFEPTCFDTLEASLFLYPELDRHALAAMADILELGDTPHRALADAEATAALLVAQCGRAAALHADDRGLLSAAGWEPLAVLDALSRARGRSGGEAEPPPVAEAAGEWPAATEATPEPLACDPDGWRPAFGAGGALARAMKGFAERPGQSGLAEAVSTMFGAGGIGLFEAGTGMGKSLAYLLPAAFSAASEGRRVVISTKTKALQRQLAERELPTVAGCLPEDWRWALLMGRENYLCRRLLREAVAETGRSLPDRERLLGLAYLSGRARRGEVDLSALPYRAQQVLPALADLAREVRSSSSSCLGRRCSERGSCYWRRARAQAQRAHLLCVNHALLLTGADTLPAFDDLVVDEAHLLPDEAVSAFTERVDERSLDDLVREARGRRGQKSLAAIVRAAARGAEAPLAAALESAAQGYEQAAAELPGLIADVAASLVAVTTAPDGDDDRDGQAPSSDSGYAQTRLLTAGLQRQPAFDEFVTVAASLAAGLSALARAASLTAEALPEEHRDRPRAVSLGAGAEAAAALLLECTDVPPPETVAWIETGGRVPPARTRPQGAAPGRPPATPWSLNRAPLSPAPLIRERLWDRLRSAVLVSATIGAGGSFDYYRREAGLALDLEVVERAFPSPFDYRRQAALVLEHDPQTAWAAAAQPARVAERLRRLTQITGGRMLALFTNRRELEQVVATIGPHIDDDGVVLLAQGMHGSAAALAEEFRSHPATLLLGVDTLWTGQDFPGDTLVCLVIAKLPFPRQDARFAARRRAAELEGRDWFREFYLPEAVLKFRQGFGRLIRSETDVGVVVVLDHRLTKKSYERQFLDSLPEMEVVRAAPDELPDVVGQLLLRRGALAETPAGL